MAKDDKTKDTSMTTAEAGRMGGEKVLNERGRDFYSEIGKMQGKENNPGNFANRPKKEVQEAGAEGGRNSHRGDNDSVADNAGSDAGSDSGDEE